MNNKLLRNQPLSGKAMPSGKIVLVISILLLLSACDAKDDCLDKGGHYNEQTQTCEQ